MADKPKRFSQKEIRREPISPEELDSWVCYVQEEKYEAVKKEAIEISKEDIRIIVHLINCRIDACRDIDAVISVETVRPGNYVAYYDIAPFKFRFHAKETFENYAKFKNVSISGGDRIFLYNS